MTGTAVTRRPSFLRTFGFGDDIWPGWRELFGHELRVEENVDDKEYVVRVEAPGIDPEKDVEVTVEGGILSIGVERREERHEESKGAKRSEFCYGSFHRSVALPKGATGDDVKATYADGILEVRMPIEQRADDVHRVEVTRI